MQWKDEGIILARKPHGEKAAVLHVLTRDHGRHAGLVRAAASLRMKACLQPGNTVQVTWRARLAEHLGQYSVELIKPRVAWIIEDPLALNALNSLTVLCNLLSERDPVPKLYDGLEIILDNLTHKNVWPALMVRYEMEVLEQLGFGLDLGQCALTGARQNLAWVSPRTGRAASFDAGAPHADKLLVLPDFLNGRPGKNPPGHEEILSGFQLTGFFLDRNVYTPRGLSPPDARTRLIRALQR